MGLELQCLFSQLSDLRFKSCSVPLLKSDLLLRVAKSMFISFVNHSTLWRPRQQALLLRDYEETSAPPHLLLPTSLIPPYTHTHTPPLQIARVYVPGRPVNFPSWVYRFADISGINLLLRIVMPMQMYTRFLSVIVYCVSGCWFTQEIVLSVSVDYTDKGRTGIWDKRRPNYDTGDKQWSATLVFLIL